MTGGWNVPFEEQPAAPLYDQDGALVSGGVTVMAAMTRTSLGTHPLLVLRFDVPGMPDGEPMPSVVLLMDAEHLQQLPGLVTAAVASAIRKAADQ